MFWNNLKIAFRLLMKQRFYAFINIFGLTTALACCLLMGLYIQQELTYDRYHQNADRIHRVVFDNYLDLGAYATLPLPIAPALKADFPEIERCARIAGAFESIVKQEQNRFFERLTFVDNDLPQLFTMPFVAGNPQTALAEPNQVILSESYAKKYFGESNPIGKTLEVGTSGSLNATVTGVFKDFPANSHIRFDLGLSFATFDKVYGTPTLWQQMPQNYTYIQLAENASPAQLRSKLKDFAKAHVANELENWETAYRLNLQPITSIHLNSHLENEFEPNGRWATIYLFACIALIVLMIAGFNYVNQSTARFAKRAKEVGILKTIGAGRNQLIGQFISETLLITLFAGVGALLLAQLVLPIFNSISGRELQIAQMYQPLIIAGLTTLVVLTGLGAGVFPAFILSGFKPVEAFRGRVGNVSLFNSLRQTLVVSQFTISIALIVATLIVQQQMNYVRQSFRPAGKEQVVTFQVNNELNEKYDVLKQKLLAQPGVLQVSACSNMPTFYGDSWPIMRDLNSPKIQTENYAMKDDFIETMGLELIVGRGLDEERSSDVTGGFVINETAVKELGFESSEKALGQTILWGGGSNKKQGTVLGIVKDFHFGSFHDIIPPALLQFSPYDWMTPNFIAIRLNIDNYETIAAEIRKTVAELSPTWYADVRFMDDNVAQLHQKDIQLGRLFGAFSILAIIISCLGLLGLSTYVVEQRIKEIGIRKVMGASISQITTLLSKDFIKLVLIANGIAFPIAWWAMDKWLEDFAYRADLSWWIFAIAGVGAIAIALLTVSFQAIRAALANPVNSLRSE
ncbi:MAG: ABC transporter permease [Saprospiraceae bacterium]|nr:ABC transporter permease [Saprospiraceae bacterium]